MRKRSMKKSMRRLRDVERLAFDGPGGATEDTENTEINTEQCNKYLFRVFSVEPSGSLTMRILSFRED